MRRRLKCAARQARGTRKCQKNKHFVPLNSLTVANAESYTWRMTLRQSSAVGLLLAGLAFAVPAILHAQAQPRVVYASAIDEKGAPVAGLGPTDFVVREDKVQREVLNVAPSSDPMQIALLVDNSQAAESYVRDIREAVSTFIGTVGADPSGAKHQVAVITIGERPTINTDYTLNLEQAKKGAQRIFAMSDSGAYLLDGIIETSKSIKKRESTHPVIVAVITSGVELSDRPYQSVLEPLRSGGAALHVLVVGRPITGDHDREMVLDVGTRDTGGRYDTVLTGTGLTPRLKQLAEELTHQYKVTYAQPQRLIQPDKVTVSGAKPGITIRGIAQLTGSESGRR